MLNTPPPICRKSGLETVVPRAQQDNFAIYLSNLPQILQKYNKNLGIKEELYCDRQFVAKNWQKK